MKKINFTVSHGLYLLSFILILVGIYFKSHDLHSSGLSMTKSGSPYKAVALDGNGILFIAAVIFGCGYLLRDK